MTIFEEVVKNITAEDFADILVKPCVVNRNELYYITSTGQLYPFTDEGYRSALSLQIRYLNSESPNKEKEKKTENSDESSDQIPLFNMDNN